MTNLLNAASGDTQARTADLRELNRLSGLGATFPTLSWEGKMRSVLTISQANDRKTALLAKLASTAATFLCEVEPDKVRRCQGPRCRHYILARTSKHLWCSPTGCGNRARVARHYERERQDSTESQT